MNNLFSRETIMMYSAPPEGLGVGLLVTFSE